MGYQCVEFYAPYFEWTEGQTKQTRQLLDDLGVRCYSTHNSFEYFNKDNLARARDKNLILGCKYMVMASSPQQSSLDGWKSVADVLNSAAEQLEPAGLKPGYHNHQPEFTPVEGKRPIEVLAKNTKPSVMLQLTWAPACRQAQTRSPGFKPIPGGSAPCTAKTGLLTRPRAIRFCSAKVWRTGRRSLRLRNMAEDWSIS